MLKNGAALWLAVPAVVSVFLLLPVGGCGGDDKGPTKTNADECTQTQIDCSGICADLASHPDHCGACGSTCSVIEVCSRGNCAMSCNAGLESCNRSCTDVRANNQHCGACDAACEAGLVCLRGECALQCPVGLTLCDGGCVNLANNVLNCGECSSWCTASEVCSQGHCEAACEWGLEDCNGSCVDKKSDVSNCGACGNQCAEGEVCAEGICASECPSGLVECDRGCVNYATDLLHCGSCGAWCELGTQCSNGSCRERYASCSEGFLECGDECFDVRYDPMHCGDCDTECSGGGENEYPVCHNGACFTNCEPGYADCSEAPGCETFVLEDNDNCGYCGVRCDTELMFDDYDYARQTCRMGMCLSTPIDVVSCDYVGGKLVAVEGCGEWASPELLPPSCCADYDVKPCNSSEKNWVLACECNEQGTCFDPYQDNADLSPPQHGACVPLSDWLDQENLLENGVCGMMGDY